MSTRTLPLAHPVSDKEMHDRAVQLLWTTLSTLTERNWSRFRVDTLKAESGWTLRHHYVNRTWELTLTAPNGHARSMSFTDRDELPTVADLITFADYGVVPVNAK